MRLIAVLCGLVTAAVVAAIVFFFAGFYDVSALHGGNVVVAWALRNVRRASVAHYASAPSPPESLDSGDMIQAGA